MIELNQSWAGPYHASGEKIIKAGDFVAGGVAIASAKNSSCGK